jgi:hypothetical protein
LAIATIRASLAANFLNSTDAKLSIPTATIVMSTISETVTTSANPRCTLRRALPVRKHPPGTFNRLLEEIIAGEIYNAHTLGQARRFLSPTPPARPNPQFPRQFGCRFQLRLDFSRRINDSIPPARFAAIFPNSSCPPS